MNPRQRAREAAVDSPLGEDALLLRRMVAREELGQPFEFELDLLSEQEVEPRRILGEPAGVRLLLPAGAWRRFNGIVCRFERLGMHDRYLSYRAVLRPRLWLLTRRSDCRIFKNKTVPEIVRSVLHEVGADDVSIRLRQKYPAREYCVQYRETHFDFISRLMEQEGIYYYFTHAENRHTMVLADSISAHQRETGYESIPYYPRANIRQREDDHIYDWTLAAEIQPGTYAHADFDFERPAARLLAQKSAPQAGAYPGGEIYDYPGRFTTPDDGQRYAGVRAEELGARYEVRHGEGNARGVQAGGLFALSGFPQDEENREYLVVSATHVIESDEFETGQAGDEEIYRCTFTAIHSQTPYRPPCRTPRPVVQGPQTAIVVGTSDINTDRYGRVQVAFHWDRKRETSCYVRVAQFWAGRQWGAMFLPRAGQEVVVEFLDGDPDRPVITGRVYNADEMPPYKLPDEATKSTVKSASTPGGGGGNEIRMEDKAGSEELYLHAQKDMNVVVENDHADEAKANRRVKAARDIVVEAGTKITLKCGAGTIEMGNDGSITLKGVRVTVEGATLEAKSTATTTVKGPMLNLEGAAIAGLKGGLVKIN